MTAPKVKRIDTVFLPVTNLDRSVEWYTEHLGLTLRWKAKGYAALNVGETAFTLVESDEIPAAGRMPFNFFAPDLRGMHETMKAAGVEVSELRDHGDLLEFLFKDPDGNSLGLVWFQDI